MTRWIETDKGDPRCRELADRHYTRVHVGHPMWTRPGWNQVLFAEQKNGRRAVFVWWRPKWEDGRPGTARMAPIRRLLPDACRAEAQRPPRRALDGPLCSR